MPEITVIIPVYNTGILLKESLQDICNQSYKDYEIICVDDCSDDDLTKQILSEFSIKIKCFTLVRQKENYGAAAARNKGLELARGKYVIFLDADDRFEKNMLKKLHTSIWENDADISICGYTVFDHQTGELIERNCLKKKRNVTDRVFDIYELGEDGLTYWNIALFNKLIKRELILDNEIWFQDVPTANDVYFMVMCNLTAKRIVYCEKGIPLIKYRSNREGQISSNRDPFNFWKAYLKIEEDCRYYGINVDNMLISFLLNASGYELSNAGDSLVGECFYNVISEYLNQVPVSELLEYTSNINKLKNYRNLSYSSEWFNVKNVYMEELVNAREDILKKLETDNIIVWGCGYSGRAIETFLFREGFHNVRVTDSDIEKISDVSMGGFPMITVDEVTEISDTILASNSDIYVDLLKRNLKNRIIDMGKYMKL